MDIFFFQAKGLAILGLGREPQRRIFKIIMPFYRYILWIFLVYFIGMYTIFIVENYKNFMEVALSFTANCIDIICVGKVFLFRNRLDRLYALMEKLQESEKLTIIS
jgi:hypothetical protein